MRIRVLGAAAGGGFPQWNAGDAANSSARGGSARAATQASVAVSADGERWVVVNASPDIRAQFSASPCLHPRARRGTPMAAMVLTNGDVDAIAGLLSLREGTAFALYAHAAVLGVLDANPVFEVLERALVPRRTLPLGTAEEVLDAAGIATGIAVQAFAVVGKVPLYLERDRDGDAPVETTGADTIGLEISAGGASFLYLANVAAVDAVLAAKMTGATLVLFDGTLYAEDEMIVAGVGTKTAARMGHMAMDGPGGSVAALAPLGIGRKVFIHINNTNPVLLAGSAERARVEAAGFEVAHDGMEIEL